MVGFDAVDAGDELVGVGHAGDDGILRLDEGRLREGDIGWSDGVTQVYCIL